MTIYKLDIKYNDLNFCATSEKRGGLGISLQTSEENFLHLIFTTKDDNENFCHYVFNRIQPGDNLQFTYGIANADTVQNIADLEKVPSSGDTLALTPGMRIGLDLTLKDRTDKLRLSYPKNGGFMFMLGNIPLDHARTFIMAGNQEEEWNWQFPDLYPGDSVSMKIVETDWHSPYPRIT